jgi:ribosomal-protein-alanine N-acetyltransferase
MNTTNRTQRQSAGTARVVLRRPGLPDEREFLARVRESRALHHPWVAPPSTPREFGQYLVRTQEPIHRGWLVCSKPAGDIAGVFNISNIVRGVFQSGYLSYYAFAGFERQGLMAEGLRAVIRQAFGAMKLHRLEANIQPANAASIALVKSCGFSREGYSPRYLKIAGRWRDHERWALLAS